MRTLACVAVCSLPLAAQLWAFTAVHQVHKHKGAQRLQRNAAAPGVDVEIISPAAKSAGNSQDFSASDDMSDDIVEEERQLARDALLAAITPLDRGFDADEDSRTEVARLIAGLADLNPTVEPAKELNGTWTLLYTNAPDILGIPTGPFAQLGRIGQEIDSTRGTITNVIEYTPSSLVSGFLGAVQEDTLLQRVVTEYEVVSDTQVDLKIRGLGFQPRRVFGLDLPSVASVGVQGPLSLPFGSFEVLYLDEELRIVRTAQGWYSINRREPQ